MRSKKLLGVLMATTMILGCIAGCGSNSSTESSSTTETTTTEATTAETATTVEETTTEVVEATSDFDLSKSISVTSREDGSGTRGAFIELFGIEQKDADGNKVDHTTEDANITNSTSVMMTTVAGDEYSIGYISLGSLNDTVKAVKIDGVEATVDNIKSGEYTIARPFNIVTKDGLSEVAKDFINFIMSAEGQAVIDENGYISSEGEAFAGTEAAGKVVVAGSSSVSPVMEKLKEAYEAVNANAEIEIQTSDSTTGVTSTIEGICDIGMASRGLKDTETGVEATTIAMDGIAVIVNNSNVVEDLTTEQVMNIFVGETTTWEEVAK